MGLALSFRDPGMDCETGGDDGGLRAAKGAGVDGDLAARRGFAALPGDRSSAVSAIADGRAGVSDSITASAGSAGTMPLIVSRALSPRGVYSHPSPL